MPSHRRPPRSTMCTCPTNLTVYATDRINGGVYILEPDRALAARMRQAAW